MASFVYSEAANQIAKATLDFDTDTFSLLLCGFGDTCGTEPDVTNLAGFTTLVEFAGANYARKSLGAGTVTEDGANFRAEVTWADQTWTALGNDAAGTTPGAVIYKDGASDAARLPVAFIDGGGFPFNGTGSDVTLDLNDEGAIQLTCLKPANSFWYTNAAEQIARGSIDLDDAGTEIKVLLVTTGSDAATLRSAATVSAFDAGTLKEYADAAYARKVLGSKSVDADDGNNQAEFNADATTVWSALGAEDGGDNCIGAVIYKNVSGDVDATNIPIAFVGDGGFPFNGSGSDVTFTWNAADGILNLQHG